MFAFDFIVFPTPTPMYTIKDYDIKYVAVQNKNSDMKEKTRQVPYVIFEHPSGLASTYLIYFHGNAEDLKYASEFVFNLQQYLNVNCVVIEYPGYGVYEFYQPSEQLIYEDSLQLYDKIQQIQNERKKNNNQNQKHLGIIDYNKSKDSDDIIIFGRSIGSGPAVYLASQRKCKLLITMSAYQSIKKIGRDKVGFLSALMKDKFNNIDRIRDIQCPAFMVHGYSDPLINYNHTQQLFNNINPEFKEKSGTCFPPNMTHNDYNLYLDLIEPIIEHCLKININIEYVTQGQFQQQQELKQQLQQYVQDQLKEQNQEHFCQQDQQLSYNQQQANLNIRTIFQ